MGESARVESIEALEIFKRALWKFQEAANVALGDAEAESHHVMRWLENEQRSYWQDQIRKRQELVARASEAVRQKKLFKDSTGKTPSAIEEEKALQLAKRRLEEAEQKLMNVRRYTPLLQKEIQTYKGSVQRFATSVQADLPAAAHQLTALLIKLEEYVAIKPEDATSAAPPTESSDQVQSVAPEAQPES
jgi:hypothetical protein